MSTTPEQLRDTARTEPSARDDAPLWEILRMATEAKMPHVAEAATWALVNNIDLSRPRR